MGELIKQHRYFVDLSSAPPRNVNDTANLVSMSATTQCRGLVDVLLSPSLFYSLFLSLDAHGIGVLTLSLLLFLSALWRCSNRATKFHTQTHTYFHNYCVVASRFRPIYNQRKCGQINGVTNAIPILTFPLLCFYLPLPLSLYFRSLESS